MQERPPWIGITVGDPAGIGPEIVRRAVSDGRPRAARLIVLGPEALCPPEVPRVADVAEEEGAPLVWLSTQGGPVNWQVGKPTVASGRAALEALRLGCDLALGGRIQALVTAPVSKQGLHLAGEKVEGQTQLLARWSGVDSIQMLAVAPGLRVVPLTRHMPLREALEEISADRVVEGLLHMQRGFEDLGWSRPHLALAGLNPHAGEGGLLGREELDILEPAVERARAAGVRVTGPVSPDTVFRRARAGEFDGVLALYHDQAFIPIKLGGDESSITVLLGLPFLRVSPAHGTAFDIAGRGLARADSLAFALEQAILWSRRKVVRSSLS